MRATTRSTKTVRPKVTSRVIRCERGARRSNRPKWHTSHIVQATKKRIAASAASGTCEANGANSTMTSTRNTECTMPASGLVAPFLTFVAARAIAPVAAKPPKTGVSMFARPCPTCSWFGLRRVPVMPSATTAVSSDSIAPSTDRGHARELPGGLNGGRRQHRRRDRRWQAPERHAERQGDAKWAAALDAPFRLRSKPIFDAA
jgi:hypothetical protein